MKNKIIPLLLLALALLMIGFGVFRGEGETVLAKAINLCLECVGIG
ncbi:MAG: CD1871A family CXXC motif-containing protein [Oscillospiraceae bacterium]